MVMGKGILTSTLVAALLLFLTAGCVISGTGTLNIRNEMTACRRITALYLFEQGSMNKGSSIISTPLCPNESHTEMAVYPGYYTIEAEIDYGAETAVTGQTVEEGTYYIIRISDSYIL
jgi:hypothetical protein